MPWRWPGSPEGRYDVGIGRRNPAVGASDDAGPCAVPEATPSTEPGQEVAQRGGFELPAVEVPVGAEHAMRRSVGLTEHVDFVNGIWP